jgi:hypothetical protein
LSPTLVRQFIIFFNEVDDGDLILERAEIRTENNLLKDEDSEIKQSSRRAEKSVEFIIKTSLLLQMWTCHSSDGWSPASHCGCPGSIPSQIMWDLWWAKWHWGRFAPSTSVSLANSHSTVCSKLTIIYHPGLVQ